GGAALRVQELLGGAGPAPQTGALQALGSAARPGRPQDQARRRRQATAQRAAVVTARRVVRGLTRRGVTGRHAPGGSAPRRSVASGSTAGGASRRASDRA